MKDNDNLPDCQIMLNADRGNDDDEQFDDDFCDELNDEGLELWLRRCQRHGWQSDPDW